jgi:hypothetical protein
MLPSTSLQPAPAPFKILMDSSARLGPDRKLLIAGSRVSFQTISKAEPVTNKNAFSSSKVFSITFSYLQKLCYCKVLKVVYRVYEFIYKVVLRSPR